MIVIHYPAAFRALDLFVDQFNEKATKASARLRTGAVMCAKEIIRIYGISLLKANGYQIVQENNLPSLQTNNQQLAKLVKCSARSIQRYIVKLQKAGVITGKNFRGTNANFELWLNPAILQVGQKLNPAKCKQDVKDALERLKKLEENAVAGQSQKPNCPDTYTGNIYNNLVIGFDKSKIRLKSLVLPTAKANEPVDKIAGDISARYTGEIALKKIEKRTFFAQKSEGSAKIFEGTGEIASRVVQPVSVESLTSPTRDNSLSLYASLMWLTARNMLYKNTDLTESQISIAKDLIRKLYEPVAEDKLDHVHQHYIARLALVAKYVQKDPTKRFVPVPSWYFDTKNAKGFVGTKLWYRAELIRKREVEREMLVKRLIRKYHNNEKKEPSKRKPSLNLFRECENTIGKLGDPALSQYFYAAVLQPETYQQLSLNLTR